MRERSKLRFRREDGGGRFRVRFMIYDSFVFVFDVRVVLNGFFCRGGWANERNKERKSTWTNVQKTLQCKRATKDGARSCGRSRLTHGTIVMPEFFLSSFLQDAELMFHAHADMSKTWTCCTTAMSDRHFSWTSMMTNAQQCMTARFVPIHSLIALLFILWSCCLLLAGVFTNHHQSIAWCDPCRFIHPYTQHWSSSWSWSWSFSWLRCPFFCSRCFHERPRATFTPCRQRRSCGPMSCPTVPRSCRCRKIPGKSYCCVCILCTIFVARVLLPWNGDMNNHVSCMYVLGMKPHGCQVRHDIFCWSVCLHGGATVDCCTRTPKSPHAYSNCDGRAELVHVQGKKVVPNAW